MIRKAKKTSNKNTEKKLLQYCIIGLIFQMESCCQLPSCAKKDTADDIEYELGIVVEHKQFL